MGWLGGKKDEAAGAGAPGATYVSDLEQPLPVAEPVQATKVNMQPVPAAVTDGLPPLPRHPTILTQCPHCGAQKVNTRIRTAPNWMTICLVILWLAFFYVMLPFGMWFCWIPLCVDAFKDTEHYCQQCNAKVGSVPPLTNCCVKMRG